MGKNEEWAYERINNIRNSRERLRKKYTDNQQQKEAEREGKWLSSHGPQTDICPAVLIFADML